MAGAGGGHEDERAAVVRQAQGKVVILVIQENGGVKTADRLKRGAAHHENGAGQNAYASVIGAGVAGWFGRMGQEIGVAFVAGAPGVIDHDGTKGRGLGVAGGGGKQGVQRAGVKAGIGVDEKQKLGFHARCAQIAARAKAKVAGADMHGDAARGGPGAHPVIRAIVDDDQRQGRRQALGQSGQDAGRVVGDGNGGDGQHRVVLVGGTKAGQGGIVTGGETGGLPKDSVCG